MKITVDSSGVDDFLSSKFISGAFLQSTFWEDFIKTQGKRVWRLNIEDEGQILASGLFYENRLPTGKSYLYSPKGPIFSDSLTQPQQEKALKIILSKLRDITVYTDKREEIFLRVELIDASQLLPQFRKSKDVQPRDSQILKLEKSEEELLAGMHQKTRYNINLAKKKGVKVEFADKEKDLDHFLKLVKNTSNRNNIQPHPNSYYILLWNKIRQHKAGYLALAKKGEKVIAANMMINFGPASTYVHGSSDYEHRSLMAPHLLQWEAILHAKKQGYKFYDFWGVAPEDNSKPSWEGFTRFKKSFGGKTTYSPGAYDLVYNKGMYGVYRFIQIIKNISR